MPFLDFAAGKEEGSRSDEVTLSTTAFASRTDPSGLIQTRCRRCDIMT